MPGPPPPTNRPLVLVIRDGWGENPFPDQEPFNAVRRARTPVDAALRARWPRTLIRTSGEDVGLTEGTMGNSEVGHQNLGAGRIVDQEAVRITKACRTGALAQIEALTGPIRRARAAGRRVHLMGICSDAGVHGLLTHLVALLELAKSLEVPPRDVCLHLFTDGRDTGPTQGGGFVAHVEAECARLGVGVVASVIGRYWAMDRDHRWERVHRAYACLTGRDAAAQGIATSASALRAVESYYADPAPARAPAHAYAGGREIEIPEAPGGVLRGDEFVTPTMIGATSEELCRTRIADGDTVVFYNFRGDRPRELVAAFVLPHFEDSPEVKPSPDTGKRGFARGPRLDLEFVTMTGYSTQLAPHVRVAFPKPPPMRAIAGEHLAALGLTQFRCAETEKYPHVTFFFNDYRDQPFSGEARENPQSPRVPTYDQRPEMAALEVRDAVLARLAAPDCQDVLVVNFANADMVGHTGNLEATIRACEVVDECVGSIVDAALARGGSLIVTADHGNAEQMWDPRCQAPHTAHTLYDVALTVVGHAFAGRALRGDADPAGWHDPEVRARRGRLADVIPTALEMLSLPKPPEMTGLSLLV
ncbi:MAG TPA: 2,3-bisphosphoglycerate-independent phosphoglycerate mutase [Phycisphaerales bacterium]|nr:2,3-bisphosphoglycerate-independent phosphoglycerate mutase [Phycisphaerales bacterium]